MCFSIYPQSSSLYCILPLEPWWRVNFVHSRVLVVAQWYRRNSPSDTGVLQNAADVIDVGNFAATYGAAFCLSRLLDAYEFHTQVSLRAYTTRLAISLGRFLS